MDTFLERGRGVLAEEDHTEKPSVKKRETAKI